MAKGRADIANFVMLPVIRTSTGEGGRLVDFQASYGYKPNAGLRIVADTLYDEVGALAMLLVELKIKRAEALIQTLGDGS